MMGISGDDGDGVGDSAAEHTCQIVRVCQRIKVELDTTTSTNGGTAAGDEIWALIEFEIYDPDAVSTGNGSTYMIDDQTAKRTKKWKRFETETELSDFIRRDTGEPITLPPYSLTPQQSSKIEGEAKKSVSQITEEFRRFRVKAEMARKQSDAQIRDLQSNNVESAKRRIENKDVVRFSKT